MDVIKHGSVLPHPSLARPLDSTVLQKFAEINVLPSTLSRSNVWRYPSRLSTTTAKLSSSTDAPRKGKKSASGEKKVPSLRTVITPKRSKDSKLHDAQVVMLEKLATKKNPDETTQGKHRGHAVWEELQKLTECDSGPPCWLSYTGDSTQQENAPLFLCLPGMYVLLEPCRS